MHDFLTSSVNEISTSYAPTTVVGCEVHNVHGGNFFHKGKFTALVVYVAYNKYVMMSKILLIRTSATPLPNVTLTFKTYLEHMFISACHRI